MTDTLAAAVMENPAVVGLLVALPSAALGYLGYRRSRHNDQVAERAGIATSQSTSIGQVIEGYDKLVADLQDDREACRAQARADREACREQVRELKRQLAAASANPLPSNG